jgi:Fe-S-cluster-containing hydrogenase component 2
VSKLGNPLHALQAGTWFKLICGASFQHLPDVRNLALAYTLAGADCIDVAADPAVIAAARRGMQTAFQLAGDVPFLGPIDRLPWLMVSLNDAEDPHFRKAAFDPARCPADCPRPCERICPARAIVFTESHQGVLDDRCYGCGRCLPVCPLGHIITRSTVSAPATLLPKLFECGIDAIELHTQVGHWPDFQRLWQAIAPWLDRLQLISISCPDDRDALAYLQAISDFISPLPIPSLWQTDGRPMSGDIGAGTTLAAVRYGQKVLEAQLPGFVQLAGGTNHYTVPKLQATGLLKWARADTAEDSADTPYIAGVAYGSYARKLLSPVLDRLIPTDIATDITTNMTTPPLVRTGGDRTLSATTAPSFFPLDSPPQLLLETDPELLDRAVSLARSLVSQLKAEVVPY